MLIQKTPIGFVVWVLSEDKDLELLNQEIDRLKDLGKVAVFYSGEQDFKQTITSLIMYNSNCRI